MIRNDDAISPYQLAMIIIMTVISVGVFSISSDIADAAGTDAWLIILLAGFVNILAAMIVVKLNTRFPGKTFGDYAQELIGTIPGKIILLLFIAYLTSVIAYELRAFTEVVKMFLLFRTPTEIIILSLILVCTYVVRGGVECIGRINELIFPMLFIPFFLMLLPGVNLLHFDNLLPMFQDIPKKLLMALPLTAYNFVGIELALFYIGFMKEPQKAYKPMILSICFITLFFAVITVICIAAFGTEYVPKLIWPLVNYVRAINLPGLFIERLDGILLSLWIMTIFTTIVTVYFVITYSLAKIFNTREQKQYVLPMVVVIYYLSLQPDSLAQLFKWGGLFFPFATPFFLYFVPLFFLLIARIRKKGVKGNEKA